MEDHVFRRITDLEKENIRLARERNEQKRTIEELEGNYGIISDALAAKKSEIRVLKERADAVSASNGLLARENEQYKLRIGIEELRDSVRKVSDGYAQLKKRVENSKCEEATSAMRKVSVDMKAALQKMSEGVAVAVSKEEIVRINKMREMMNRDDATIWTAFGAGFLAAFAFVGMAWCSKK